MHKSSRSNKYKIGILSAYMHCDTCKNELQFVSFYDADGTMAEFYCDHCFKRKITRIQTQFFNPRKEK